MKVSIAMIVLLVLLGYAVGFSPRGLHLPTAMLRSDLAASTAVREPASDFAGSFLAQKNFILMEKFLDPHNGNLTETATECVNFCDESFNVFLNQKIAACEKEADKKVLGRIRYEVNSARQKKLIEADQILREILQSGGLKQMEAKLQYHLVRMNIDMAFMVILQLNIEDARRAGVEKALQIMTHLSTKIVEHQDAIVSPPVRLLRLLMRTDDAFVRKQMLRQKLILRPDGDFTKTRAVTLEGGDPTTGVGMEVKMMDAEGEATATTVPQCEHIVVEAVQKWGGADVTVTQLRETITDVLAQMSGIGGDEDTLQDLTEKGATLQQEVLEVMMELDTPKVSDQVCDD